MKKVNLSITIAIIITMVGCGFDKKTESGQPTKSKEIRVETMVAEASPPDVVLNYSGIIVPSVKTPLSFQLPGQVKKIFVDEGDRVNRGQLLAELDKTTVESSLQMAKALQAQAQDAYDRLEKVYDKGSLPEIQWEEIKSKLQQANSAVKIAEQSLHNSIILSPSSGVIGSRNLEVGSTATPGISVFDLLTIDKVYVRISVPENEIGKIKKKQVAQISIPAIGLSSIEAHVSKIGVSANLISKTYEVKLIMDNPGLLIKPGMACDINLEIIEEPEISIPYRAVIKDSDEQKYVYVVEGSGKKAVKQKVKVGEFSNNEITITSGIRIGDVVVVEGQHKLHDNADIIFN